MTPQRISSRQRGLGLIDALIALVILSFGMLAMTRFQARLLSQSTEAQNRLVATQQADELLSMALLDPTSSTGTSNGPCYTVPAAGVCPTPAAASAAAGWAANAVSRLPRGATAPTARATWDAGTSQLTVTLTWTGKVVQDGVAADDHQLSVTTDVR